MVEAGVGVNPRREGFGVTGVYEDQSHFSRDDRRHFGEPPMRDLQRLRELATE